jgi:SAM-dependent methyltransferase
MFEQRSYSAELLDNDDIPAQDLYQNLRELDFINRYLGGHDVVIKAIKKMLVDLPKSREIHLLEIGSGGGDNLRAIAKWGKKSGYNFKLTGVDLKKDCTDFAVENSQKFDIEFLTSDYREAPFNRIGKPDIVFNSLFCHHFTDDQLTSMLKWMDENTTVGYTICDLHRHPLAYFSIKLLTSLFSKSYLVKNDAPLSVRRGFVKKELNSLLTDAHQKSFKIKWAWAFRWIVTAKH